MPKLPMVKDRELIRVLKKLGFFQHPERGTSHLVFKHRDGRMTTVARHPGKTSRAERFGRFYAISMSYPTNSSRF